MIITLTYLQEQTRIRNHEAGGDALPTLYYSTELAGEVGELCNKLKKRARTRVKTWRHLPVPRHEELAEEIGDILICTMLLANKLGINTTDAVVNKFNRSSDELKLETKL